MDDARPTRERKGRLLLRRTGASAVNHLLFSVIVFAAYYLLLTVYSPCFAGTIRITTQPTTKLEGERLHVVIRVTNNGDAPAHQVRADAEILGERFTSQVQTRLGSGQTTEFSFDKVLHPSSRGTFLLTVLVHFQDANHYPFSALTCTTFFVRERGDAAISGTAAPLSMQDDGIVRVQVQNTGPDSRKVRATLQLPNEFSCERPSVYFSLRSGEKKNLPFPVRNMSAIYGASYPVFVVQEYQGERMHSCSVSSAIVRIVNEGNWFRKTRWYWAGGAVLLIGLLVSASTISKIRLTNLSNQYRSLRNLKF